MNNINVCFAEIRKQNHLTQKDFADKIGMSRSSIAQIENGINNPSEQTIRRILDTFKSPVDLLEKLKQHIGNLSNTDVNELNNKNEHNNENEDFFSISFDKLLNLKSSLLTICFMLNRYGSYDFSEKEIEELNKINLGLETMYNIAFKKSNLDTKNKLLISTAIRFGDELLQNYQTRLNRSVGQILDFDELAEPPELTFPED